MTMFRGFLHRAPVCAVLLSVGVAGAGFAQRQQRQGSQPARPTQARRSPLAKAAAPRPKIATGRYIVFLQDPPVSSRYAKRELMQSAAAVAYRSQIEGNQQLLMRTLRGRNVEVTGSVSTLLNAVFVSVPASRIAEIRGLPGVIGVMPERAIPVNLNKATALANAPAAWNAVGGQSQAGAGIKIGILDTGIDQNHPAFKDSSLSVPSGFPKCNVQSDCDNFTNNKVIVARSYVRAIAAHSVCNQPTLAGCAVPTNPTPDPTTSNPDDYSARDRFGHGTAVASAAAGVQNSAGSIPFSGMAPKAWLGSYKIWGTQGVNDYPPESVWIQAIEDALKDGMDVANMSSGGWAFTGALDSTACGNASGVPCDPLASAFEAAVKAGMVITVAAGNSGLYESISSPATAPSVITVGATTNSHVLGAVVNVAGAPSSLQLIPANRGDSYFGCDPLGLTSSCAYGPAPFSPGLKAQMVDVTTLGDNGQACSSLPAGSLNGKFALIIDGGPTACTYDVKTMNAENAGAVGVVIYMASGGTLAIPENVNILGPVVEISQANGQALKSYLASNKNAVVTIDTAGQEIPLATYNQLAYYSSGGPTPDGTIKPDIVATGGFDSSSTSAYLDPTDPYLPPLNGLYVATESYDDSSVLYSQTGFIGVDGTSFASPLVAGAAALIKQAHPSWTPGQIKSALLNYSAQDVTMDDYGNLIDVQWIGAGRLDAGAAINAAVSAEPATLSFGFLKSGTALPGAISMTITNLSNASVTLAAAVKAGVSATGLSVALDQSTLTIAAGKTATLKASLSGAVPAAGEYNGVVTLTSSSPAFVVRVPYMFLVGDGVPASAIAPFGCCYGAVGTDQGPTPVQVLDQYGVPVSGTSVIFTASPKGSVTLKSMTGTPGYTGDFGFPFNGPACNPASSTSGVTCPTNNYGIAWVDVVGGSATTSSATITTSIPGISPSSAPSFNVTLIPTPAVNTSNGVLNAGSYGGTVAPGTYAAVFGTNLMDPNFLYNASGDINSSTRLPLSLDGVSVSFDAPATGNLPAISVPGYLSFVSPSQVNVFVPWELAGYSTAKVKVVFNEYIYSNVVNVAVASAAPAFLMNSGTVADAVDNTTGAIITSSNPATAGEILQLYLTGMGAVSNQPTSSGDPACGGGVVVASCTASSGLSQTGTVTVSIGGKQAQVFGGTAFLSPGYVGLYQVNIQVPTGLSAGNQPITVTVGGQTSPAQVGGNNVYLPVK